MTDNTGSNYKKYQFDPEIEVIYNRIMNKVMGAIQIIGKTVEGLEDDMAEMRLETSIKLSDMKGEIGNVRDGLRSIFTPRALGTQGTQKARKARESLLRSPFPKMKEKPSKKA